MSSTRLPRRLARSANAAEHVVLPTPPLPPKNTTRRSSSRITSATGQVADRRTFDAHATVPVVELLEEVRVHLEQVQRRRVRQAYRFHVAQEQKQVVQLGGLLPNFPLVRRENGAAKHVG